MFMAPFIIMACFLFITLYHLVYKNWKTLSGSIRVYMSSDYKEFRRAERGIQRRNRGCAKTLGRGGVRGMGVGRMGVGRMGVGTWGSIPTTPSSPIPE